MARNGDAVMTDKRCPRCGLDVVVRCFAQGRWQLACWFCWWNEPESDTDAAIRGVVA